MEQSLSERNSFMRHDLEITPFVHLLAALIVLAPRQLSFTWCNMSYAEAPCEDMWGVGSSQYLLNQRGHNVSCQFHGIAYTSTLPSANYRSSLTRNASQCDHQTLWGFWSLSSVNRDWTSDSPQTPHRALTRAFGIWLGELCSPIPRLINNDSQLN